MVRYTISDEKGAEIVEFDAALHTRTRRTVRAG